MTNSSSIHDVYFSVSISPLGWCLVGLVGIALFVLIFRPFAGRDD